MPGREPRAGAALRRARGVGRRTSTTSGGLTFGRCPMAATPRTSATVEEGLCRRGRRRRRSPPGGCTAPSVSSRPRVYARVGAFVAFGGAGAEACWVGRVVARVAQWGRSGGAEVARPLALV